MEAFLDKIKPHYRMIAATAAVLYVIKKYADLKAPHHSICYSMSSAERDEQPLRDVYPQYFKSKSGLWLHVRRWLPQITPGYNQLPKGVVFLVHGYGEHIGRYEHIAERLSKLGYYVCGMDHQGHGQSDGDRAHVERFEHFVQDYLSFMAAEQAFLIADWQLRQQVQTQIESASIPPCFIFGHSMGGLIAYFIALATQGLELPRLDSLFSPGLDETKSLMLSPLPSKPSNTFVPSTPPQAPRTPAMIATTPVKQSPPSLALSTKIPQIPESSQLLSKMPSTSELGQFSSQSTEEAQLKRCASVSPTNPQTIVSLAKGLWPLRGVIFSSPAFALDPWSSSPMAQFIAGILSTIAPKLGVSSLNDKHISSIPQVIARYRADPLNYTGMIRARLGYEFASAIKRANNSFSDFTVPFLIIHGERDRICPTTGSRALFDKSGSADKSLKIYNRSLHEVFLDVDSARAMLDVVTWMRDRTEA